MKRAPIRPLEVAFALAQADDVLGIDCLRHDRSPMASEPQLLWFTIGGQN
jgi:hypothetical protein